MRSATRSERILLTTSANTGRFQYTGQAAIPQLGLYYYKARFYNPALGRFMQTDPIGYDDDNNLYAYVGNDPFNKTDPSGETCAQATSGGAYACQVDSMLTKNKDGSTTTTQRNDFTAAQTKQVAAFEKSYTAAVNMLTSDPSAKATVPVNGKSETVTAGYVATQLAKRNVVAAPGERGGASTNRVNNTTTVKSNGLSGVGKLQGVKTPTPDSLRQVAIVHEGMHATFVDNVGGGMLSSDFDSAHQIPYNQAAATLLGGEQ